MSKKISRSNTLGKSGRFGVTVLIPARGGSKGINKKNLRLVGGVSLVGRAIAVAKKVPGVNAVVVSTDDNEVASEAASHGATVHHRSAALSGDEAVVADLIRDFFGIGRPPTAPSLEIGNSRFFLLLEPTAPLRTISTVSACLRKVLGGADSSATMGAARVHPLRVFCLEDDGSVAPFMPSVDAWKPRQTLAPVYQMTGGAYVCDLESFPLQGNSLMFGKFSPLIVGDYEAVDVDSLLDLSVADYLARAGSDAEL